MGILTLHPLVFADGLTQLPAANAQDDERAKQDEAADHHTCAKKFLTIRSLDICTDTRWACATPRRKALGRGGLKEHRHVYTRAIDMPSVRPI